MAPLLLASLVLASAGGDRLAKAKKQAAALDFSAALVTVREALEAGDAAASETAQIHAYTAELAAALGDRSLALAEFARALTLNPSLDLPAASPRIREPLAEARKQVGTKTFSVSAASQRLADGSVSTAVTWAGDLYSLAAAGRVYVERDGQFVKVDDPRSWSCPADPCRYWANVVDAHGNELQRTGAPETPFTIAPLEKAPVAAAPGGPPARTTTTSERRWYTRAGPYLALAAAALAGAGVGFGVQFNSEQAQLIDVEAHRSMHTMAEAMALDSARQRDRVLLFGFLGAAAVAAVIAVFTW